MQVQVHYVPRLWTHTVRASGVGEPGTIIVRVDSSVVGLYTVLTPLNIIRPQILAWWWIMTLWINSSISRGLMFKQSVKVVYNAGRAGDLSHPKNTNPSGVYTSVIYNQDAMKVQRHWTCITLSTGLTPLLYSCICLQLKAWNALRYRCLAFLGYYPPWRDQDDSGIHSKTSPKHETTYSL